MSTEVATLAGGCYWCLEAIYEQLQGVESVVSGFSGGTVKNPSYREVCEGTTGHAEAVQVTFDPKILSYREVLDFFFAFHDPTTLNRQGGDVGTQYRSAIFFHSPEQERVARDLVDRITRDKVFGNPIVTEIVPAAEFHMAEEGHQEYFRRVGGGNPYCSFVIEPKVAKFRKLYMERLKR